MIEKLISNEEVYNSIVNDMDKVIRGLTNRLTDFIPSNEINEVAFPNLIFSIKIMCIKTFDQGILW